MNVLVLDTETSIHNKGHPRDSRNKLVCYSWWTEDGGDAELWSSNLSLDVLIEAADLIVGFNFKFDLHWLLKYNVKRLRHKQIWDVQIAEFILSNQTNKFPSLEETAQKYTLGSKIDVIKTEYWEKGISTEDIPWDVLKPYAVKDAELTYYCYLAQIKLMTPAQRRLCLLMCQDLQILQEMEANGMPFDEELCKQRAEVLDVQITQLRETLAGTYPSIPINFASNDHVSAFLYGGTIKEDGKEFVGYFKAGARAGQPKYRNIIIEHHLPRLYEPLRGSEMAKKGNYATDEGTLRKLKGNKQIVSMLLELSKLEKRNGTYYRGLVGLRESMCWPVGILHGNFNQTTAATGRLSSSRPNLQNFDSELLDIFVSNFKD